MAKRVRAGWTAKGEGKQRSYTHESGWRVAHCGHPTALWPWGVYDPRGAIHLSGVTCAHGYAFRLLDDAIAHAERHVRDGAAACRLDVPA